jgi:hypothetical protein
LLEIVAEVCVETADGFLEKTTMLELPLSLESWSLPVVDDLIFHKSKDVGF